MKSNSRLSSFRFAINGIKHFVKTEKNAKIQILLALIALVLGYIFNISNIEWILILVCIGGVISLEIINTSIENMADFINNSIHPQIKIIKDLSAGAVLVFSIIAFLISVIIFIPKIYTYF
jgi:diacylglycerol kinase